MHGSDFGKGDRVEMPSASVRSVPALDQDRRLDHAGASRGVSDRAGL